MRNIKLKIEYDGTNFNGWQSQKDSSLRTIQQTVEKAIKLITNEEIEVFGCSRTDSGVHAREYVLNFHTNSRVPGEKFKDAINTKLPDDVIVLESEEVNEEFHARYHSIGKTYSYAILNRRERAPIGRAYMYHHRHRLDLEAMKKACKYFEGKHDFSALKSLGSSALTSVRTISDLHIEVDNDVIRVFVSADGFLYNMVRIIVGTLLMVGSGRVEPEYVEKIILSKDRSKAGKCVPPHGLTLEKVFY